MRNGGPLCRDASTAPHDMARSLPPALRPRTGEDEDCLPRPPSGRDDVGSWESATLVRYRSCRAERSGAETSPRIRAAPFGHATLRRGFSTSPLPRSGLWSKRPGFYGRCLPLTATGHVERSGRGAETSLWTWRTRTGPLVPWRSLRFGPQGPSGRDDVLFYGVCLLCPLPIVSSGADAEPRPLLDGWRTRSVCCTPWRLLHSGPPRVGPPVEATGILWALLLSSATGHVERSGRGAETSLRACRGQSGVLMPWRLLHFGSPQSSLRSK